MRLRIKVCGALVCAAALGAWSGGGGLIDHDAAAASEIILADGSETTEAPADPAPRDPDASVDEETPATDGEEDADADENGAGSNILLIAIVVFVVGALVALLARSRRSGPQGGQHPAPVERRAVRTPAIDLGDRVLGDVGWLNEQLALDLLAAQPEEAVQRWRTERPRIDALTRDCQRLEESTADVSWGALAGEVASLAQALDTATAARAGAAVDPSVLHQSVDLVNRRRSQVSSMLTEVKRRR